MDAFLTIFWVDHKTPISLKIIIFWQAARRKWKLRFSTSIFWCTLYCMSYFILMKFQAFILICYWLKLSTWKANWIKPRVVCLIIIYYPKTVSIVSPQSVPPRHGTLLVSITCMFSRCNACFIIKRIIRKMQRPWRGYLHLETWKTKYFQFSEFIS